MQEIKLNTTVPEAELIMNALAELPFKRVNNLLGKLHKQITEQVAPPVNIPPDENNGA